MSKQNMSKQTILIPVDGSAFSRQIFSTIRRFFAPETTDLLLFEVVEAMSRPFTDANVVSASEMVASAVLSGGAGYAERQAENENRQYQAGQAIRHQHEETLHEIAEEMEAAGYTVKTHAEIGDPAEQIVSFAETADVDLIAMVTHGRSGLSKLVMGSVAQQVLHEATVPVLLVRPTSA